MAGYCATAFAAPAEVEPTSLQPGVPFARTLAEGATDRYEIAVSPGEWRFRLAPSGNTALLRVLGPDGAEVLAVSTWRGLGFESAFVVPLENAGACTVEISAEHRGAPVGAYQVLAEPLRTGLPADRALAEAEQAFTAAALLPPGSDPAAAAAIAERLGAAAEGLARLGLRRPEIMARIVLSTFAADFYPPLAATAAAAAVDLAESLGEDPLRAQALEQRGILHQNRGELAEARHDFAAAAAIWAARGTVLGALRDRLNVATLLVRSGSFEDARARFAELRPEIDARGERRLAVGLHAGLGGAAANLGDSEPAIAELRAALAIADELGERRLEAQIRNDLGVLLRRLGESGAAIAELQAALDAFRALDDRAWMARALNNLGFAYLTLGALPRARSAFGEALALRRVAGDRAGESVTLKNLARLSLAAGELGAAGSLAAEAAGIDRALGNRRGEAGAFRLAGLVDARSGDKTAARAGFDRALELYRELKDRPGAASVLLARGELHAGGSDPAALADLETAAAEAAVLGDRALEVSAQVALARFERRRGGLEAAGRRLEAALAGIDGLRTAIADPGQRATFLASRAEAYELAIDVLLDRLAAEPAAGFAERAFEIAERARARTLLDWLEAPASDLLAGLPASLAERFRTARRRLNGRAQRRLELLAGGADAASVDAALAETHAALAELEAVRAELGRSNLAWAELTANATLPAAKIRGLLGADDTLLEFRLGAERSVLWVVGSRGIVPYFLPARGTLEELARQAAADLSRRNLRTGATRPESAAAVSAALFGQLPPETFRPGRRLAIVADGALQLLPFGALPLPGGGGFLLDRVELVELPSASALAAQRRFAAGRPAAPGQLAIFADPVFSPDDPRLGGVAAVPAAGFLSGYGRLPETRAEAAAVLALAPAGKVLAAFDFDAGREAFDSGEVAGYRVLHLATHGVAAEESPELAGVLLSQFGPDGRPRHGLLGMQDLLGLRLGAELVVLSGCRTAFGRETAGEGPIGLARGFLYAGASRVLASLWPVEDAAARRLMVDFYAAFFAGRPAAAALREAQLRLREDPAFTDPHHWGAFVLIGDWR